MSRLREVCPYCSSPLDEDGLCTAKRELAQQIAGLPAESMTKYGLARRPLKLDEFSRSLQTELAPCRDQNILSKADVYLQNKKEFLSVDFHVTVYTKKKKARQEFEDDKSTRVPAFINIRDTYSGEGVKVGEDWTFSHVPPLDFWISFYRGKSFVVMTASLPLFFESKLPLLKTEHKFIAWCIDVARIVDNNILSLSLK